MKRAGSSPARSGRRRQPFAERALPLAEQLEVEIPDPLGGPHPEQLPNAAATTWSTNCSAPRSWRSWSTSARASTREPVTRRAHGRRRRRRRHRRRPRGVRAPSSSCRSLQAGALYEGNYPLATALGAAADRAAAGRVAREHGADGRRARLHRQGQRPGPVRRRRSQTLAPDLQSLAPVREWKWTREQEIEYAARARHRGRGDARRRSSASTRTSGAGSIEAGILEDPWVERRPRRLQWTADPRAGARRARGGRDHLRARASRGPRRRASSTARRADRAS